MVLRALLLSVCCALLPVLSLSAAEAEATAAPAGYDDVVIENAVARVVISSQRASISLFELKGSHPINLPKHLHRDEPIVTGPGDDGKPALGVLGPFVAPATPNALSDGLNQHGWLRSDTPKVTFWGLAPTLLSAWTVGSHSASEATLTWVDAQGLAYAVTYRMHATLPQVAVTATMHNRSPAEVTLNPSIIPINGIHQDYGPNEAAYLTAFVDHGGEHGEMTKADITDPTAVTAEKPLKAVAESGQNVGFVGLKSRFFAVWWTPGALTLDGPEAAAAKPAAPVSGPDADLNAAPAAAGGPRWRADFTSFVSRVHADHQAKLWVTYGAIPVPAGRTLSWDWTLTASGLTHKDLAVFGAAEQRIELLDFMHRFFIIFTRPLVWVLDHIVMVVPNYAIAVILLTLLVKALMFRLTWAQHSSMIKMQKLAPDLKYIQEQYKNDKTKLAQKQMELWKKNGVNPLGGCLPLLVQIPIFIGLYNAFQYNADMRGASFLWISDLTLPDQVWGMPIALLSGWMLSINPLPLIYIAVTIWMSLTSPMPTNGDPQQEQMAKTMRWMPVLFGVIFYNMPAGLVLYFTVNAVLSTIEVKFIRRRLASR